VTVTVWHQLFEGDDRPVNAREFFPDTFFIKAATVDGDVSEAFALTQNIKESWVDSRNSRVRATGQSRRSSMVGDVMIEFGPAEHVRMIMVAPRGFMPFEAKEEED
jgi:hypothetical protein